MVPWACGSLRAWLKKRKHLEKWAKVEQLTPSAGSVTSSSVSSHEKPEVLLTPRPQTLCVYQLESSLKTQTFSPLSANFRQPGTTRTQVGLIFSKELYSWFKNQYQPYMLSSCTGDGLDQFLLTDWISITLNFSMKKSVTCYVISIHRGT